MTAMVKVMPSEGKKIREPRTGLPMEQNKVYNVPLSQFWLKRLKEGDVVEAKRPAVSKPKKAKKAETKKPMGEDK